MARSSDRVAAILATAWLDKALEKALLRNMIADLPDKERKGLFDGSGTAPLASTATKIHLAYALELYGPITRDDLTWVRGLEAHEVSRSGINGLTVADTGAAMLTCA